MTVIDQLIFVAALLFALGSLGAIIFWILYRAGKQKAFKRGVACFEKGQYSPALYYFGQAEKGWGINIAHKTPKSILKDLDRLDVIIAKVAEAASELGHIVDIAKLHDMIEARREIWSNRTYLKFGSHTLKNAILERDRQIVNSIETMRYQLRGIYPPKPTS